MTPRKRQAGGRLWVDGLVEAFWLFAGSAVVAWLCILAWAFTQ